MLRFALPTAFVLAASLFAGCAITPSEQAKAIINADEKQVKNCQFLGNLKGTSSQTGVARIIGKENAKIEVLEKAVAKGATHVVWVNISAHWFGPSADAKAYNCNKSGPSNKELWKASLIPAKKIPVKVVNNEVVYDYKCPAGYHEIDCPEVEDIVYRDEHKCDEAYDNKQKKYIYDCKWHKVQVGVKTIPMSKCQGLSFICEPDETQKP